MRKLKKLIPIGGRRQTSVCVVAYSMGSGDRTTDQPIIAWMQEAPTDEMAGIVTINGRKVLVDYVMDNFQYVEEAPTSGGGLVRRLVTFELIPAELENGNVQPYLPNNEFREFFRGLYVGGASARDIYFEVYAFDRIYQLNDLRDTTCLGIFRMDAGIGWEEATGTTKMSLLDITLQDDNYVGSSDNTIDDTIFIYNPWFDGKVFPIAYGRVPRVRLINGTPTFDPMDLSNTITGQVVSNFTGSATEIILEEGTNLGSVIRYLSTFNPTLKININDEVIQGDLTYDSVTDRVKLVNLTRNVPYGVVKGYTHSDTGEDPSDWGIPNWPVTYSLRTTTVINARTVIRDSRGWARCTLRYFDNTQSPFPYITETNYSFEFEGFDAEEGTIKHGLLEHPTDPSTYEPTVLSASWNDTPTFDNPIYVGTSITNNLFFLDKPQDIELFFRDPSIGASAGSAGDKWEIVAIVSQDDVGGFTFEAYIREGDCDLDDDHIYAEGDGKLVKIPEAEVTVTRNQTAFGESGLIRVQITDAPVNLGIGATSNIIYADCLWRTNRLPPDLTREVLNKEGSILHRFLGDSFNPSGTSAWPYYGAIFRGDETVSEFLDRLCFQCGMRLYWEGGKLECGTFAPPPKYLKYAQGATQHGLNAQSITVNDVYDLNSGSLNIGRTFTGVFDSYYEFKKMHLQVSYGGWEDPFVSESRPQTKQAIPRSYVPYNYYYDLINDRTSARYAVLQSLTAGHPSQYSTVDRSMSALCQVSALKFGVLDRVKWRDFPFITDRDTVIFDSSSFLYTNPTTSRDFIHTGFGVVTGVAFSINSSDGVSVAITAKLSQIATPAITELIDDPLADPPSGTPADPTDGAPSEPDDPPNDPEGPPTGKPPSPTDPPTDESTLKTMNVTLDCDPDCNLDSDDGVELDLEVKTEDPFHLGFSANFRYVNPLTSAESGLLTHSVGNGDNIGAAVTSSATLNIPNSWFEERRSVTISIKAYVTYNDGETTDEESYSKQVRIDRPPGIAAS